MLDTKLFGNELNRYGFSIFSGVPCSFLKNLINYAINECEYIAATNEGDAISICAGAFIGGKKSVVLMQNSGLGNAVSPLTSLNYPFKIPVLGFVSLRGETGIGDEPQHELMGQITEGMLDIMKIKWGYLSCNLEEAKKQIYEANKLIDNNQSFFFIVKKNTFDAVQLKMQKDIIRENLSKERRYREAEVITRYEALQLINKLKESQTIQITTTGKTGIELYEIEDGLTNLYMVGSMGCASSLGLGLALSKKNKDIIVIDGDGSVLMRMGSLATIGYYNPSNMVHILLDNYSYDSTGGQSTVSNTVNFVNIATACGYTKAIYCHNLNELEIAIKDWKKSKMLTFIYLPISKGSRKELGRPKLKPYEVKERLKVSISD